MLKVHIRRTLFAALIAGLLGFFIAYRSDKIYEANVEILAGSPTIQADPTMPLEVRRILLPGVLNDLDSDTGILKSQRIFKEGLTKAAKELGKDDLLGAKAFQDLYPMFDLDIPNSLNAYAPDQQRVVRIRVKAYEPATAASVANNVALSFAEYRKNRAKLAIRDAYDMVSSQAKRAKKELDRIDAAYRDLKASNNIADLNKAEANISDALEGARATRNRYDSDLAGAEAELATLVVQLQKTPKYIQSSTSTQLDPKINTYLQVVTQADIELSNARQIYTDDAPQVKRALEKLKRAQDQYNQEEKAQKKINAGSLTSINTNYADLESKVSVARSRVNGLKDQLGPINSSILRYEQRASEIPGIETKYFDLQRNRLVYEEQYQKNQKWVEDLQNTLEGQTSQIQSLADKDLITDPVAPDTKKYVILAAIVGSLIGLAYSFALESFKLPVHTSWQLAELTALPVAASIPMMPKPLARRHYSEIRDGNFKPIESFRYMAFSMMAKENRPRVILFTGVGEDVDSTGAAAEFAVAMAKTGSRTALVDCDLRVPRLSELFGVQGRSGVAEILGRTILPGESTDLFVNTEHDNLMILPAGAASATGLSDFITSHMSGLIEDLRDKADTVVINCAPVDVFADASRLAQYVDETCLVISAKTTSYRAIPVAQEILQKSGAKEMSIVLTNASPTEEPFGSRSGASVARR